MFLGLIILAYVGLIFVEANREEVVIRFWNSQSHPTALGFVVLTSALIGMVFSSCLCSVEIIMLHLQNRKLKRRILALRPSAPAQTPSAAKTPLAASDVTAAGKGFSA